MKNEEHRFSCFFDDSQKFDDHFHIWFANKFPRQNVSIFSASIENHVRFCGRKQNYFFFVLFDCVTPNTSKNQREEKKMWKHISSSNNNNYNNILNPKH